MQVQELRELDAEELSGRLKGARRELYELRFKLAVGQLDNPQPDQGRAPRDRADPDHRSRTCFWTSRSTRRTRPSRRWRRCRSRKRRPTRCRRWRKPRRTRPMGWRRRQMSRTGLRQRSRTRPTRTRTRTTPKKKKKRKTRPAKTAKSPGRGGEGMTDATTQAPAPERGFTQGPRRPCGLGQDAEDGHGRQSGRKATACTRRRPAPDQVQGRTTRRTVPASATWYGSTETRPISKDKRWRVVEIVEKAR